MTSKEKYALCLNLYKDIVFGYSIAYENDGELYIRHLRDVDHSIFEQKKRFFRKQGRSKGLLSEKDRIQLLIDTGQWSQEEEVKFKDHETELTNLLKSREGMFLESQRRMIEERITKKEKEIDKSSKARNELQLQTIESYSESKINDYILQHCLFKDEDLKEPLYTAQTYGQLDIEKIAAYSGLYYETLKDFNEENLKRIGHCAFFLNSYIISKNNPYYFFGKKVTDLSAYQTSICSYGNGCKNVLEHTENTMPKLEDVDDIVAWYTRERDVIDKRFSSKTKRGASPPPSSGGLKPKNEKFTATAIPHGSAEEVRNLGAADDATPINFTEAANKLKERLGKESLDARDLVKMHE